MNAIPGKKVPQGAFSGFVPSPLPPSLAWTPRLLNRLSDADRRIGQLAGEGGRLPNPHVLIRPFARQEAVLSSRIEGTQATLGELLAAEAGAEVARRPADLREVGNYVAALEHGVLRLRELPICVRLVRELHAKLMAGVAGQPAAPGQFRRVQNWIGRPGCTAATASFVPPPPDDVEPCLAEWEKFLHASELPPLVTIALANYQFEAIHPFLDGNGRVTRLLVLPLIHAFMEVQGRTHLLEHLEGFRYPLSGEFCADLETLSSYGMPRGWGLEMCLLCEVFQHLATNELCQVDLGFNFEHRHRSVSNSPSSNAIITGLVASATEVASTLAAHVVDGSTAEENAKLLNDVIGRYRQIASEWVPRYQHDALLNGLRYDLADEQRAVQVFTAALADAFQIHDGDIAPRCIEQPSSKEALANVPGLSEAILRAAMR